MGRVVAALSGGEVGLVDLHFASGLCDELLGGDGGEVVALNLLDDRGLVEGAELREVVEMSLRERCLGVVACGEVLQVGGDVVVDREQLADLALGFAGGFGELLLIETELIAKSSKGVRGFDRSQIHSLPVVDDLVDEHVSSRCRLHPTGEFGQSGFASGSETAASVDDHVFVMLDAPSHGQRLLDAARFNRRFEFGHLGGLEHLTRLFGIRDQHVALD